MSLPPLLSRKAALKQGLRFYFTGKPCPRGHIATRRVVSYACCACEPIIANKHYHRNADKISKEYKERYKVKKDTWNVRKKQWRQENAASVAETMRLWRATNKAFEAESKRSWVEANRGRKNYATAKRHAAKMQRTPCWLEPDQEWMMREIYSLASLRSKITGVKWHVDHVVPLQGKTVSGLHVPWNLQVLPAVENISKGNRFQ